MKSGWTVVLISVGSVIFMFVLAMLCIHLSVKKDKKITKRAKEVEKRRGNGKCWRCKGEGCSFCGGTGDCQTCKGRGIQGGIRCKDCSNNYHYVRTGRDG